MAGSKSAYYKAMDKMFEYLASSTKIIITTDTSPEGLGLTVSGCSSNNPACLVVASIGGTSYFSIGDYGAGRQVTIGACSCDMVVNSGIASQVVLVSVSSDVSYITTCTTQQLTQGGKANIGSWIIQIANPT